ncbi:hypothetical protein KI387_016838, partial [Taxus chinensis]
MGICGLVFGFLFGLVMSLPLPILEEHEGSLPFPFAPSARLTNLSISQGPGKLVPHFNHLVFNYSAILAPHVTKFTITLYLPQQQVDKHYAASIDSMPLKSGVESPLLKLGKRGETITYQIFVTAINHRPSMYLLLARR